MSKRNLAVCSWSLRPRDPVELLERLRATGLNRVQLALAPMVAQPEVWRGAIDELRTNGIVIESGMLAMASEDYSSMACDPTRIGPPIARAPRTLRTLPTSSVFRW